MKVKIPLLLLPVLYASVIQTQTVQAQSASIGTGNFFERWTARTSATQATQPGWIVPLVTTQTTLIQVLRFDALRQIAPARTNTWNIDGSKGLNLVPYARIELAIYAPPYIEHNTKAKDGAGDLSFLGKYRIAAGNEAHGNYNLSAWVLATIPTGSYANGSHDATIQPNLGGGKGWGSFDLQSTLGSTLPLGNTTYKSAGRPILWNTVAQYRIGKLWWPEIESNATFYKGGTNDGHTQEFVTPGLLFGKCRIHPGDPRSRPGAVVGAGIQIATSQFHTYNHELVVTGRFIF